MVNRMRLTALLFVSLITIAVMTYTAVAPSTTSPITIFELEVVSLVELHNNPDTYDGTMAYRKISIVGEFSELAPHRSTITQDSYSLVIDTTEENLFEGFNIGDGVKLTGVFYYNQIGDDLFVPIYVLHYPVEDRNDVEISTITQDQVSFNGKKIRIVGNLSSIEESMGRYVLYVTDPGTNDELKVMFYGMTDLEPGTIIKVSGLYNGGILHSEDMGKYYPPMSLTSLIPGFSGLTALTVFGILTILFKREKYNG
ncbi:MAG: hypothetical protein P1P69_00530 [Methanosarcinaceae archaeon]|nr:hypothetical protein [Methanosarcinaceae archaeon]MDF1532977.1 hypothetical protein [Methanosarcinaceae archaeon]